MFNSSPRMGLGLKSQTSELVGPATYFICTLKTPENRVPFLSTEKRKPSFCKNPIIDVFYTIPSERISGGISPRFTSPRSGWEECPTPGPADYNITAGPEKSPSRPHGRGKLYLCKVPLSGKAIGPSVPTKINENGYWLDAEGNIFRIPPDVHDTTLGPAFYYIKEDNSYKYKGCKWSKRTSKRISYSVDNNPGPAYYDIEPRLNCQEVESQHFREIAKKMSFLPRYCDDLICRVQRENLPGPADYCVSSESKCKECSSIYPRPFIKAAKRFEEITNENPGPTKYNLKAEKYPVSKLSVPFSTCTPRFSCRKAAKAPGPADYYINRLECNEGISTLVPFGSTTTRPNVVPADLYCYPSPADYDINFNTKCKIPNSSVFKSKVVRFPSDRQREMNATDRQFNPMGAFKKLTSKRSHNATKVGFNTKAPLVGMFSSLNYENPGPADYAYDKTSELARCKGYAIPVSCRFPNLDKVSPGPTDYTIHPSYSRAINKAFASHSLTVRESITKQKLKKHPRETWKKWSTTLRKHKQLKCFVGGGFGFTHC